METLRRALVHQGHVRLHISGSAAKLPADASHVLQRHLAVLTDVAHPDPRPITRTFTLRTVGADIILVACFR